MNCFTRVTLNLAFSAAIVSSAFAGERVTLSNGFVQDCDHHAQIGDRVRLYLSAGEENYIEYAPNEISAYEALPDVPGSAAIAAGTQQTLTASDLREMLAAAGQAHNVDIDLLASVVKAESGGNARAVSHAGAQGLMQLMPSTAANLGVKDSFQPDQNVRGCSAYLDALLSRYHDNLALALAAYNAGPEAVDKYHGIPPYHETRVYVARVIHEFNRRVQARELRVRQTTSTRVAQTNSSR